MTTDIIKRLKKLSLFKDTAEDILVKIAAGAKMRELVKGDVLVQAGDPSQSLFVIRRGWVKIVTTGLKGEEVILNQCGPGQIIGEMSLIDKQPRSNTMIAISPVTLMEIEYRVILEVLDEQPVLAMSFLKDMSARLRFANAYIEESIEWCHHIATGNYEFVEKQVELTQSTIIDMTRSNEARASAFLSSFFKMVKDVRKREENLKAQVQKLTIEIDEVKRQQAVTELTKSDFFEELQEAAQKLRQKRSDDLKRPSSQSDPEEDL